MASLLILIFATALRIWGLHFGLPHLYHADEPIVVNHALAYGAGDLNPHFFNIPPLPSYLLFGIYGALFFSGKFLHLWQSTEQFADAFFQDPTLFYLTGRIALGVIPAVFSIYFFMQWVKRAGFSSTWKHWGGVLFAVCFVHVSDAHYIYADMLLVLAGILFFLALQAADFGQLKSHLILGGLVGAATALKYNGVFFAVPYLWLSGSSSFRKPLQLTSFWLLAGLAALTAFICLNPYAVLDWTFFLREIKEQSAANQGVPFWHHLTYSLAEGMGWPLIILGFIGAAKSFFSSNIQRQAVAVFCFAYYLVLWQKGQPYGRYILPLVPFLIFLALDAAQWLFQKGRIGKSVVIICFAASIAFNLTKAVLFDLIIARQDVRAEAAEWIEENIPSGSRIALDGTSFTPRLHFSCEQLRDKLSKKTADADRRIEVKLKNCMQQPGFELYFLSDQPGANPFLFASPEIQPHFSTLQSRQIEYVLVVFDMKLRNELQEKGKLIQRWSPYKEDSIQLWQLDSQIITGGPFTWSDLFARRANGYSIELYALDFD